MSQSNEGGDEPLLPDMGPENDQILANSNQDELQVFAGDEYTPQLPRSLAQVPPRTVRLFSRDNTNPSIHVLVDQHGDRIRDDWSMLRTMRSLVVIFCGVSDDDRIYY